MSNFNTEGSYRVAELQAQKNRPQKSVSLRISDILFVADLVDVWCFDSSTAVDKRQADSFVPVRMRISEHE